ncbi:MAG: membrane integrity-associated transporter subunit PqiC, partial [Burkholderiaceae bacterium]|nr:membrane integrity-associated transporter subunit PqiC [Burkholderiaceae bacterium]
MSASASRRRALALAASGAAAAALAATSGCVSIGGGDAAVPVWYRLEDPGEGARASPLADAGRPAPTSGASRATAGAAQGAPGAVRPAVQLDRVLLVGLVDAPGFYDSTMVAFSRARGTIAHYQFAGWAERPGRRIAMLVERRLTSRARFAAVAQSTAGVRGDLLLNLSL